MTLLHHWHELGLIGLVVAAVVAIQVFLPGVLPALLRWVIGTQWGRMLLLAALALACMRWYGDARFSKGYSAAVAEQKTASDRARVDAAVGVLNAYMDGAKAMAAIGATQEKGHADARAAGAGVTAGLRTGTVQLRDEWACLPVPATAAAVSGGDDAAELRRQGAGDLVEVGDSADTDLKACQATVAEYQRIGVLRPQP